MICVSEFSDVCKFSEKLVETERDGEEIQVGTLADCGMWHLQKLACSQARIWRF